YLRASWELIDDPRDADLCLVSLDTGAAPPGGARRVGCAARPREFPKGTLYRPLRVPQLLAVLSETSRALAESGGGETGAARPAGGARRVGCAARPREFPKGTLYRPLRVPQLLAVLSETSRAFAESGGVEPGAARPAGDTQAGPALRLLAWPLDLEGTSRLRL